MSLDIKSLKKLAATCRKAGIKSFKNAEFEFTLTEDAPVVLTRRKASAAAPIPESPSTNIPSDSLSDEELLFWSSGVIQDEEPTGVV